MARIVRRRVRKKRRPATVDLPSATPVAGSPEQQPSSVLLVGQARFRALLAWKLGAGGGVRVLAEIDGETGAFDPMFAPRAHVVIAQAGTAYPSRNMEIARAIQRTRLGVGVVLMVERLSVQFLAAYRWELSNWSLVTAAACSDSAKLASLVESAAHGIRWVDPEVGRALHELAAAGDPHASAVMGIEDLRDIAAARGNWIGRVRNVEGTGRSEGSWLSRPTGIPGSESPL